METTSQLVTPVFTGENYSFWKIKMKTIFQTKKLWEIVQGEIPNRPMEADLSPEALQQRTRIEEAKLKDLMALQILQSAVSDNIFPRIAPATSSKEAWDALEMEFQGSAQVRMIKLQSLRREYENLKMNEGDSIDIFTTKLIGIANQLRVSGEEKSDYQVVQKILISLPERFDSIVTVLEQTKDLTSLSVTELIGTIKAHEKRVESREERSTEGAFYSKSGNKQGDKNHQKAKRWCGICKKKNHNTSDCWSKKNKNLETKRSEDKEKRCLCVISQDILRKIASLREPREQT